MEGSSRKDGTGDYDPFKERVLEHPVSNFGTFMHLFKSVFGTGILAMPIAFRASGLFLGIVATIFVAIIATHCSYIIVVCAHHLYFKAHKTSMTFAEVAEESCLRGPAWGKKLALAARIIILTGIFITYYTSCSCYAVIIAENFSYVTSYYFGYVNIRIIISALFIPCLLLCYIPNLKLLVPFSILANIFMIVGMGITFYYLVVNAPSIDDRTFVGSILDLPAHLSITLFAVECIGAVMPLENQMKTPKNFLGFCGVLIVGMIGITIIYIIIGFFGYWKYGDETKGSITLNLPRESYAAQIVNILIGLAIYCTFGLQFYVCLEIAWDCIKEKFTKRKTLANYLLRTVLVAFAILLSIAVPKIAPFVGLIGAFCFSILGLICPILIEIVLFWDEGFGRFYWKLIKDIIVIILGVMCLIFGSYFAMKEIILTYTNS